MAVYMAALQPGDTILSLELSHGGHLTHGLKVNFSGRLYTIVHYGVSRETNVVDYDEVLDKRAREPAAPDRLRRVRLPTHGGHGEVPRDRGRGRRASAVRHGPLRRPRRGRAAAEPGRALRLRHVDDAQDARRAALRVHPLPGGARAGGRPRRLPGDAGRAARSTRSPRRRRASGSRRPRRSATTSPQVRTNADTLSETLMEGGLDVLTGGTDTHLLQLDLRSTDWTGKDAEERLHEVKLTVNRNTVPFDERRRRSRAASGSAHPPRRCAGWTRRTSARSGGSSSGALGESPTSLRCRAGPRRCARSARSTRGSAAGRRTCRDSD